MNTARQISVRSFPRAILHADADAFFTSVEEVLDPGLRGRPLVTGKERGIIACASYAAKKLGVVRGLSLADARKICPGLVILPSDYESYSLYSKRMFNIMRKYSPQVEEYSIDEAFVDITGTRRLFRCSYADIARKLKDEIHAELGLTVSVGLSLSKSLAKLCSKFRKPNGLTAVPGRYIHILLERTPLEKVWGFGPNTVSLLEQRGLRNALDYVSRPMAWAGKLLGKPGREIWLELRGESVWKVTPEDKTTYATIMKSKTFTPASSDREVVYAKLIRNVEAAFRKARRYRLRPRALGVALRRQDFRHDGLEARLNRATASDLEALPLVRGLFDRAFVPGTDYRATMIVLGFLEDDRIEQFELFEDRLRIDSLRRITATVDSVNRRYGKHALCSGTSLFLARKPESTRDARPERHQRLLRGETPARRLAIPRGDMVV
jgi:DNA polymerase-4/DNA polymerase V